MFGLPHATEVSRRVVKEKLYANTSINTQLRELIKDQIEVVIWRNKLAADTFNVSGGETVSEIQVFEVELRQRELDKRILPVIAKVIPYKILFVLTYQDELQAWIEAPGIFYNTSWLPQSDLALRFDGLNLDVVYENLARQIAGWQLDTGG